MSISNIKFKVWDPAVRLSHWVIVILFVIAYLSGENGPFEVHRIAGGALLAVLLFRIIWGFVGSSTARFSNFLTPPAVAWKYTKKSLFRRGNHTYPGHNPLGGWSVMILFTLLLVQTITGLFASSDNASNGPLAYTVPYFYSDLSAKIHTTAQGFLLVLIGIHILAILYYRLAKKDDLLTPMIVGYRKSWPGAPHAAKMQSQWLALVIVALCFAAVFWLYTFDPLNAKPQITSSVVNAPANVTAPQQPSDNKANEKFASPVK